MSASLQEQDPSATIRTILVVEDEVLVRMPLAEYLRDCGYRVFEAASVAEAKAVLDADTLPDKPPTEVWCGFRNRPALLWLGASLQIYQGPPRAVIVSGRLPLMAKSRLEHRR